MDVFIFNSSPVERQPRKKYQNTYLKIKYEIKNLISDKYLLGLVKAGTPYMIASEK